MGMLFNSMSYTFSQGGTFNISLNWRDITERKFLEKNTYEESHSLTIFSSFHHWIGLKCGYVVCQDVIKIQKGGEQKKTLRTKNLLES
jgi:hypothetical protein